VTNDNLRDVDMLDVVRSFACGVNGRIIYTSNGGQNWVSQTSITAGTLWGIDFINQTTATAAGSLGIIRTTNTGVTWFDQTPPGNHYFNDIDFVDVNIGIAICTEGHVLRTINGGNTWVQTDSIGNTLYDVNFVDANNAFVAGYDGITGQIFRSTNGGLNWVLQNSNTTEPLLSVMFADANNGLITGANGTLIRTSNAGVISGTNNSYGRNNLGLPITDFQNTNDSLNVSITDHSTVPIVTRLYLKIDTVLHTNDGDLEFYLEHNGITDTLAYQNGGSGDNFIGTLLNDATNFPLVSGSSPYRGSFKPHRPLSKFNGMNPNGYWKLRIYDRANGNTGTLEAWSLNITYAQVIGITGNQNIPAKFDLFQNFPNPFNPLTKIKFSIPGGNGKDLNVLLKIYDILGREVTTLINQQMRTGSYTVEWNAGNFASGVYFYRLEADSYAETKKMVLVK
jgi:subtilisin-like proprotein convertase family protein